jgi:hypothetical protein
VEVLLCLDLYRIFGFHRTVWSKHLTIFIKSIAEEEIALSKILGFGGEIIQKSKKGARNINDFVSVNESVNSIIENVIRLQKLT